MKFFFPDSQDQIDPSFDFVTENRSNLRVRQRDDLYAHEALGEAVYSGILVSKTIVDGLGNVTGKYTLAQRHRLYRGGVRDFFRLDVVKGPRLETMGDCGAFSYVREDVPPFSVDEVIDFYEGCGFDIGVSIDHVVLGYDAHADSSLLGPRGVPEAWRQRRELTIELAAEFLAKHRSRRCRFFPMGVAQGWSPASYASSVESLQKMGFTRIALGGMVPLKTPDIVASLKAAASIRRPGVTFHLFGVTRHDQLETFLSHGVTSFDSTSPFRQAFKDDKDNYYTPGGSLVAIRVPQVDANPKLKGRIRAGEVDQRNAVRLERNCLELLHRFDRDEVGVDVVVAALRAYEQVFDPGKDRSVFYRAILDARPWKECCCKICREAGIDVIVFRGSERNKRRGFHNLYVFSRRLARLMDEVEEGQQPRGTRKAVHLGD